VVDSGLIWGMAWGRGRSTKSTKMAKHRVKQRENNTTIWGEGNSPFAPPSLYPSLFNSNHNTLSDS